MSKENNPGNYFDDPQVIKLCEAVMDGDLATIEKLVESGVELNARGRDGMTPLLFSLVGLNKTGLERLLTHGANPNLQTKNKDSFMRYAARASDSAYLKMGLENGGDPNLRGKMDRTLLFEVAMENNDTVKNNLQLLLDRGADIDAVDKSQETAAMAAAGINQYVPALYLLEQGSDYSHEDRWGYTISHPISENGIGYNPGSEGYDARTRIAQFLIDKGIEVQLKAPYKAPGDWLEKSFSAIGKPVPDHLR